MVMPTLESMADMLDGTSFALLGDTITYDGDTIKAMVDHADEQVSVGAIAQTIIVTVLKSAVPVRPTSANRIMLPRLAGKTFQPANVKLDDTGLGWLFDLKEIKNG